jgi:hypothetical protein
LPILQPLYEDVQVETFQGKYQVQLEILPESTLTRDDIQRVLELASWRKDPNTEPVSYEGGRGILVPRKEPITIQDQKLETLLISGIGYRKMLVDDSGNASVEEDIFYPPSTENFMDGLPKGLIGYSYAKGEEIVDEFDGYSPLGTYTTETLKEKIEQTRLASGLGLTKLIVPPIEAYGRFVNEELQNDSGNFGFLVFSVPENNKRFRERLRNIICSGKEDNTILNHVLQSMQSFISVIYPGLYELHWKGYAHGSTHLSNWYSENKAILSDWETTQKLDGNRIDNALNCLIDFHRPIVEMCHLIKDFEIDQELLEKIEEAIFYDAIENYCPERYPGFNLDPRKIDLRDKDSKTRPELIEWMKQCMETELSLKIV